jgi:two-component system phosphate regulon sensor histidine kinase PhoR
VFTALSIFVTVAVGVGVFFGREAGLLTFSLAMLVAGAYHINNLFKLVRWMRTPSEESAPLPRALGMWDYVFADVNRRSQRAFTSRNACRRPSNASAKPARRCPTG